MQIPHCCTTNINYVRVSRNVLRFDVSCNAVVDLKNIVDSDSAIKYPTRHFSSIPLQ
jgi:hypothetical protein